MKTCRIASVACNAPLGAVRANLAAIEQWTVRAKAGGAEIILFPELVVNGHCDPDTARNAEPLDGPAVIELRRIANQQAIVICAGLSEREDDACYNTQILIGPDGPIGAQRKIHLSRDEVDYFQPGNQVDVFDVGLCRVGISICYDGWSPEVSRILAIKGAEILLMPHASRMKMWTDDPDSERAAANHASHFFSTIFPARAFENACYAVIVNQAGRAGTLAHYPANHPNQPHHAGGNLVIDPLGEIVAEVSTGRVEESMLITDLNPDQLRAARNHPNYTLRSRRPAIYSALTR